MNINSAFPSKYLKSADLPEDGDLILTMDDVSIETVGQDEDAEQRPILRFADHEKALVLNKTNANTIAAMYGPETENWKGQRIALFATEVAYQGKMTLAIRVRVRKPEAKTASIAEAEQAWNEHPSKETFTALCKALGATAADVTRAFGPGGVQAWLKADNTRTPARAARALADAVAF